MSNTKQYTPSEKARLYLRDRYGKKYENDTAACLDSKYDELLFGLVGGVIKDVSEVIYQIVGNRIQTEIADKIYQADDHVYSEMLGREKKHGPCPKQLRAWLLNDTKDRIRCSVGRHFLWECPINSVFYECIDPPPKDHALRAEYNKWMKRKPPKDSTKIS